MPPTSHSEAVGVVIEGESGICYGPGTDQVVPRTAGGRRYTGEDWRTVRFPADTTTFAWAHVDGATRTDVEVTVEVTDPQQVWQQSADVDIPVRNVLKQLLRDATADGTALHELTVPEIHERTTVARGLDVTALSVEVRTLAAYECESSAGEPIHVFVVENPTALGGAAEDTAPRTLQRAVDDLAADGTAGDRLDAATLDRRTNDAVVVLQAGRTVTVETDTTGGGAARLDACATIELTDPATVWQHVEDVETPLEDVLGRLLAEATADDPVETFQELTAEEIDARTTTDYGIELRSVTVERWRRTSYDLETIDGEFVRLVVLVSERLDVDVEQGEAPTALRRLVADATSDGEPLSALDAGAINARADASYGVRVERIESIEPR